MSADARKPVSLVPLEAGAGPDNPPCPACGEPLFGWIGAPSGLDGPLRRCESCGLGAVGEPGEFGDALTALDGLTVGETIRIASRAGFAAWLGGAGWSRLEPGVRYLFTPEAVRRLVANRDQVVRSVRPRPGAGIAAMWQTILNGVTFGRNVALGALGRGESIPADKPWQRRLDIAISIVAALPALMASVPLELLAATFRRGSALALRVNPL